MSDDTIPRRPAVKVEPCPRGKLQQPEPTCTNRHQCWEPCGELGHSMEHAVDAGPEESARIDKALGIVRPQAVERVHGELMGMVDLAERPVEFTTGFLQLDDPPPTSPTQQENPNG